MTDQTPTHIYVGPRQAVLSETGVADFYAGKWLVAPLGACDFIQEGCKTKAEAKACVREWQKQVPGIKVVWL
jgi:hypothetical protein